MFIYIADDDNIFTRQIIKRTWTFCTRNTANYEY